MQMKMGALCSNRRTGRVERAKILAPIQGPPRASQDEPGGMDFAGRDELQ